MSFGDASRGFRGWALGDAEAELIFRQAVELGITFWDTANAHGNGTSEEIRTLEEPSTSRQPTGF